jgi:hypothetical protein
MKIYLFDPESGIYHGEDFADDSPMRLGRNAVHPHTTTIVPPPFRRGEVPILTVAESQWQISSVCAKAAGGNGDRREQASRQEGK